jgi:hypothetical protein
LIQLNVQLETRLFDAIAEASQRARGNVQALRKILEEIVLAEDVFESERELILANLDSEFEFESMTNSEFWVKQYALRSHLERHLEQSVATLKSYLPPCHVGIETSLVVYLIPGFSKCYGPKDGVQLFGLRTGASPEETLLFLIHVFYHELSSQFYTENSRRAAANPDTAELFKHFIRLLIQNEGLANYVVLDEVLELRSNRVDFSYFTYATFISDRDATARSMSLCRKILSLIDDGNLLDLRGYVLQSLKDPRLPVINLLGIHLAQTIAATFGEQKLFSIADREPQEFFHLYNETGDSLRSHLFGPDVEACASLYF